MVKDAVSILTYFWDATSGGRPAVLLETSTIQKHSISRASNPPLMWLIFPGLLQLLDHSKLSKRMRSDISRVFSSRPAIVLHDIGYEVVWKQCKWCVEAPWGEAVHCRSGLMNGMQWKQINSMFILTFSSPYAPFLEKDNWCCNQSTSIAVCGLGLAIRWFSPVG